jgi:hypothetical protein|tara:strand:- start:2794 stop:2946 length:153 start_codon:yes stop_codon:yes gene_type:complete
MGISRVLVKFPCGLECEAEASGFGLVSEWNIKDMVCPLHGKDCKKTKEVK